MSSKPIGIARGPIAFLFLQRQTSDRPAALCSVLRFSKISLSIHTHQSLAATGKTLPLRILSAGKRLHISTVRRTCRFPERRKIVRNNELKGKTLPNRIRSHKFNFISNSVTASFPGSATIPFPPWLSDSSISVVIPVTYPIPVVIPATYPFDVVIPAKPESLYLHVYCIR
jgi:hypothetical protein